jgi:uncharacterized protein YcaQ
MPTCSIRWMVTRYGNEPVLAFIAPFDSLLWDTAPLEPVRLRLRMGGLSPPAKRRWGYYALPIVFGDRLVGRIEPRIDRVGARVEVLSVWWKDGFPPRRRLRRRYARSASRIASLFASVDRLEWAPHLATEKRLFLASP